MAASDVRIFRIEAGTSSLSEFLENTTFPLLSVTITASFSPISASSASIVSRAHAQGVCMRNTIKAVKKIKREADPSPVLHMNFTQIIFNIYFLSPLMV